MSTIDPAQQISAIAACHAVARTHYENFPVASWLLPARLRDPVAVIYAFARHADDLADEGDSSVEARRLALHVLRDKLQACVAGDSQPIDDPLFIALGSVIRTHALPLQPFDDLLSAFLQDVDTAEYADFGALMDYCRRSANPIGRLLLHLAGQTDARNLALSDAICSALQLINFLQDLRSDLELRERCYIPLDEVRRFGVTREQLLATPADPRVKALIDYQLNRAQRLLASGAELGGRLRGRFGLEIRAIIAGGDRTCRRLAERTDVHARPVLSMPDRLHILRRALLRR